MTKELSPVAQVYKDAQEIRLTQIEKSFDRLGRSKKWKAEAIREDLAASRDNTYTQEFAKEVVAIAEKMLKAIE